MSAELERPELRTSLSQAWATFERMVLPDSAPNDQRREMRRAWYAGVDWMLNSIIGELDEESEPTADDLAYMESIHAELVEFAQRIQRGLA